MITHLSGTVVEANPSQIIIDVQGVGYEVLIPTSSFSNFPPPGQTAKIFTYLVVREDAHILFGFSTVEERELFRMVNTVTKIGPKIALNLLGSLSPSEFQIAVAEGNTKRLSQISGLGKKTAERIVVELKDKVGIPSAKPSNKAGRNQSTAADQTIRDAVDALVALGYKQPEAVRRVEAAQTILGKETDLDKLVKASLAN